MPKNTPHVEGSTENLKEKQQERKFKLTGLEEIGRSIIPVPYYTFIQPSTKKAFLPDGVRAQNGYFLMQDIRQAVSELNVVILRAKRSTRLQTNELNQVEKVVSMKMLAINLDRQRPFIMSVPLTSFSALGNVFEQLELNNAENAWDYPVYLSSFEVSRPKETAAGLKHVNYWVLEATLQKEMLVGKDKEIAQEMYQDFASKLDNSEDEDDLEEIAGKGEK